eukprot:scaffold3594_cov133-Isochrysis_galbana.AAC.6
MAIGGRGPAERRSGGQASGQTDVWKLGRPGAHGPRGLRGTAAAAQQRTLPQQQAAAPATRARVEAEPALRSPAVLAPQAQPCPRASHT